MKFGIQTRLPPTGLAGDVHARGVLVGYAAPSEPALAQAVRLLADAASEITRS